MQIKLADHQIEPLKEMAKQSRRSTTQEAQIAIDQYIMPEPSSGKTIVGPVVSRKSVTSKRAKGKGGK